MDFFNGPDFPFYLKLSWYPWPIISLGGSVFGKGGTMQGKRYPRRITSIKYIMYNITNIQSQFLKVFNINALAI